MAYKKLEIDRKIELVTGRYIETKSGILLGQKDSKCTCSRERKRCGMEQLEERHISFYVKTKQKIIK